MTEDAKATGTVAARLAVQVISFAYALNDNAPPAHLVIDTRVHFATVDADERLAALTALNPEVRGAVMVMPGMPELVDGILAMVCAFGLGRQGVPVRVAIGGVDGRHTSAAIAVGVARLLQAEGASVTVVHRDMKRLDGAE